MAEQDQQIAEVVTREESRLRRFIRRRVPEAEDAEDVLQDVFYRLVEANRLLMPIDHVTGWMFRVARNRIIDLWRERKRESQFDPQADAETSLRVEDFLLVAEPGPEAVYSRNRLFEELAQAINELPAEQREVFVAHELEGRSFKEMAAATGLNINTLLSRKRYAVLHLRERLKEFVSEQ